MTTSNQIALREAEEKQRSNKAQEKFKGREIREKEKAGKFDRIMKTASLASQAGSTIGKYFMPGLNDISWYNADPQLLKDTCNISFNNPLGNKFVATHLRGTAFPTTVPGICVLNFMPTIGTTSSNGRSSTADIAAKSIYAYVRHANSGSRNYEASDLLMYLLAVCEGASYYSALRRIYSLLLTSKTHNRYYVDAMLQSIGVDPVDLRSHIADFRAYINSYAMRLNSMYIPKDLPYMCRHMWLNGTIFKDQPIKKSQEYMFVQSGYLSYDDVNGKLSLYPEDVNTSIYDLPIFSPNAKITFKQLRDQGDCIINHLVNSEDAGIMSGDILKAYGESNMAYFISVPDDYHIESEYSIDVLMQITNAMISGANFDSVNYANFDVRQISVDNVSYITQGVPYYSSNSSTNPSGYGIQCTLGNYDPNSINLNTEDSILNFYKDEVTPEDVMESTRLMFGAIRQYIGQSGSRNFGYFANEYGSELLVAGHYIRLNEDDNGETLIVKDVPGFMFQINDATELSNLMAYLTKFDWHPRCYISTSTPNDTIVRLGSTDMANYTTINNNTLQNINYCAMLSEFGVPKLGLTVRTR